MMWIPNRARDPMPWWRGRTCVMASFILALASGCATLQDPIRSNLSDADEAVARCASWYRALDQHIEQAGVRDGGEYRIPGFPYLRADRFSVSFGIEALAGDDFFQAWTGRLLGLEARARAAELRNLPADSLGNLGVDRAQAAERTRACAATLAEHDFAVPEMRGLLAARARVPDDYVTWQRALGLYALTRIPFWNGVDAWQKEATATMRRSKAGMREPAALSRYVPSAAAGTQTARTILAGARRDPLGVPQLSAGQQHALFAAFAPVIVVETSGDYDRIGTLAWGEDGGLVVDAARPVVYHKLAFTRSGGETLVQLVYLAWFSERPHETPQDLLAGRIDGIFWRVTLSMSGDALVYDTIHPCGCFHMFFPVPGVEPLPPPEEGIEWAFVPDWAPQLVDGARMVLRLATRTHYLVDIAADGAGAGLAYEFADYDELRSMPTGAGKRRSAFRPDTLMPGTERAERVFYWPMGVPSAGAMRQWGHHATAFVGRRHFDDADLIERRFRFPP
ncbi:MAG: hypothetical protein ACT4PQ_02480 [Betaproteobacteria bacterium]